MKIACLGPNGSFTSLVVKEIFPDAELIYMQTYDGCRSLKSGEIEYAVYPLENNTGGFVYDTLRAIYQTSKISVVGLEYKKIVQNLISHCDKATDIEAIYSHPNAIAQCQKKILELQKERGKEIEIVKISSTSQGVIEASKNHKIAALASKEAADLYNVPIIVSSFQDRLRNETRFVTLNISRPPEPSYKDRTMFLVEVKNTSGSLAEILNIITKLSLNIVSLTPHPVYRESGDWEYAYFIELDGHISSEPLKALCKILSGRRLQGQTRKARLIGSYPDKKILEI